MPRSLLRSFVMAAAICLPLLMDANLAAAASRPPTAASVGMQLAELKGSDSVLGDEFGYAVAISGTTAIVGAPGRDRDAGRAYVFSKSGNSWKQVAELKGSDTAADDEFGSSVATSGNTVVVGAHNRASASGRAYVFTKTATSWKQAAELKGSDTADYDNFGISVAVSGSFVVVGADGHDNTAGRAYVFTKTMTRWTQVAELKGADIASGDEFGSSVAISGSTVVVGAFGYGSFAGRAYVFAKVSTRWVQTAELGGTVTAANDYFGISVAISATTIVVGAEGQADYAGRAYVFTNTGTRWTQVAELKGSDANATDDDFGYGVAVSGNTAVVGAPGVAKVAGRAYVFSRTPTGWKQAAELKGTDIAAGDWFGYRVAISGAIALVGEYAENAPFSIAGQAYLFEA